jgi:hypothetical protein
MKESILCLVALVATYAQVHTWHNVSSNTATFCQLSQMLENGYYFVDPKGTPIVNFSLTSSAPFSYGFAIETADFNLLYGDLPFLSLPHLHRFSRSDLHPNCQCR